MTNREKLESEYTKVNWLTRRRSAAVASILSLVLAISLGAFPSTANAEVRKADVIAGQTVEERGLTVAECPSIEAEYAALIGKDGTIYFARNADSPSRIASLTKVMTAIVALDHVSDGTFVAVSEAAAEIGESSANLKAGDVMDFESALKALLVPSGNDAAVAIAETVGASMIASDPSLGNDPVEVFVQAMNEKAAELGCVDTVYENPHGLDDGIYEGRLHSTASDQTKVAQCAMGYQQIRDIVAGGSTTITVDRDGAKTPVDLETTDDLLEMYEYAIGIKTGVTDSAGPSFMGAANKEGREFYSVVLGSSDEYERFRDTRNLFEWAFDHLYRLPLANTSTWKRTSVGDAGKEVPVVAQASLADWTDKTVSVTYADPDATVDVFDFEGNVSQSFEFNELHGTVRAGDKVGTAVFKQRNLVIAEQDLVACETVEAPNPLETLGIGWQRFLGWFSGDVACAESEVLNVMPIISNNKTNAA